jgi:SWI/SNF-related matrix-associated actin-dependent regulator of chromatin subfamily A member 5
VYAIHSSTSQASSKPRRAAAAAATEAAKKPEKVPGKMTYAAMVVEAVAQMNDKNGSSLIAVRKFVQENFDIDQKQSIASFNSLTLKALTKSVATGALEKVKSSFRITYWEKKRRQELLKPKKPKAAKKAKKAKKKKLKKKLLKRTSSAKEFTEQELMFMGTAAEHNKQLRRQLFDLHDRRDAFLKARFNFFKPFLPEKNYFNRERKRHIPKEPEVPVLLPPAAAPAPKPVDKPAEKLRTLSRASSEMSLTGTKKERTTAMTAFMIQHIPTTSRSEESTSPRASAATTAVATAAPTGSAAGTGASIATDTAPTASTAATAAAPPAGQSDQPAMRPLLGSASTSWESLTSIPIAANGSSAEAHTDTIVSSVASTVPSVGNTPPSDQIVPVAPGLSTEITTTEPVKMEVDGAVETANGSVEGVTESKSDPTSAIATVSTANGTEKVLAPLLEGANEDAAEDEEEEDEEGEADVAAVTTGDNVMFAMKGVEIVDQPPMLKAKLHEHQIQGISWMAHMFKHGMPMILGDQMGLGKTIQTIGFLAYLQWKLNQRGPHLVVVPLSVLSNWISEIEKFCPSFRAVRFHGPREERNRLKNEELVDLAEFDIVVTTFEMLVSECNYFKRKYVWTTVVVDEGHRLKNEKSQLSEKLRAVPSLTKVILTGTPLQNNLRELWALLYFLSPDVFTSSTVERFEDGFDLLRGVIHTPTLRRARRLLSVYMLRRIKDQVAIKLPSKKEITIMVPLTEQQIAWYKQLICGLDSDTIDVVMRESDKEKEKTTEKTKAIEDGNNNSESSMPGSSSSSVVGEEKKKGGGGAAAGTGDSDWRKLMNLLLQLRKVCNHTYLMPDAAPDPYEIGEHMVGGSGKLLMLDRMLPRLREDGHRCLIFSQFTSMLDILEDYCELRGHTYCRLDGDTNRVKRRLDCRRFNAANSNLFIFLISTRAGGLGLNLATADTVILYDSDWNPQVDLQAMERAHRIGQTKPVRVYRLVCTGSVEERMVLRAEKKLFLNAMVAETDPDEMLNEHVHEHENADADTLNEDATEALGIGGSSMSKGELASLIRFGANAVVDGKSGNAEISDKDLDRLLERQGRDLEPPKEEGEDGKDAGSGADGAEAVDGVEQVQQAILKKLDNFDEVDLRQLGDVKYDKKKPSFKKKSNGRMEPTVDDLDEGAIVEEGEKRNRKQRIVMVSGKGTGYGGAVPILAETMDDDKEGPVGTKKSTRSRQWNHMHFCGLCGKKKLADQHVKCAHCPRVFHDYCMEDYNMPRGGSMYICPHHKCGACNRSTAAAGGMLFRCTGCLVSYCEDCLPQDEIESFGRCRDLEALGYDSKQSYFIKCPSCCQLDGVKATGVLGDQRQKKPKREKEEGDEDSSSSSSEEEEEDEPEGEEPPAFQYLPPQDLRMYWEQEPDTDEENEKARIAEEEEKARIAAEKKAAKKAAKEAAKNKGKKKGKRAAESSDDDDDDDSEEDAKRRKKPAKKSSKAKKPAKKARREADSDDSDNEGDDSDDESQDEDSDDESMTPAQRKAEAKREKERAKKEKEKERAREQKEREKAKEKARLEKMKQQEAEEKRQRKELEAKWGNVSVPRNCSMERALDIVLSHPLLYPESEGNGKKKHTPVPMNHPLSMLALRVRDKLDSGRYRSVTAYVGDVLAALAQYQKGLKGDKKAAENADYLHQFFEAKVVPNLVI